MYVLVLLASLITNSTCFVSIPFPTSLISATNISFISAISTSLISDTCTSLISVMHLYQPHLRILSHQYQPLISAISTSLSSQPSVPASLILAHTHTHIIDSRVACKMGVGQGVWYSVINDRLLKTQQLIQNAPIKINHSSHTVITLYYAITLNCCTSKSAL